MKLSRDDIGPIAGILGQQAGAVLNCKNVKDLRLRDIVAINLNGELKLYPVRLLKPILNLLTKERLVITVDPNFMVIKWSSGQYRITAQHRDFFEKDADIYQFIL